MRALLAAYLFGPGAPDDELSLSGLGAHYSSRAVFDAALGIPSGYLTADEIDALRPAVWRQLNAQAGRLRFVKTHDRYRRTAAGEAIFPPDVTIATIVIVRNPLAVAPSWAHHSGISIDESIDSMARTDAGLSTSLRRTSDQLPQDLSSWSAHVASWLDQRELPVTLVRYEDLRGDTAGSLARMLRAVGLEPDATRLAEAVAACEFERLAAREAQAGFAERAGRDRPFFRRGEATGWRQELTAEQIARIVATHRATMERLGFPTA